MKKDKIGGRHWGAPVVTEQSRLFDLGRPISESCVVARATRFNGEALAVAWPAACPAAAQPPLAR